MRPCDLTPSGAPKGVRPCYLFIIGGVLRLVNTPLKMALPESKSIAFGLHFYYWWCAIGACHYEPKAK